MELVNSANLPKDPMMKFYKNIPLKTILNKIISLSKSSSLSVWPLLKPITEPENLSKCSNLIHKLKMPTSKTLCGILNINLQSKNSKIKIHLFHWNILNLKWILIDCKGKLTKICQSKKYLSFSQWLLNQLFILLSPKLIAG